MSGAGMMVDPSDLVAMVDPDTGWISPDVYTSEAIYRLELERVFGRSWLYLAHESQLRKPGDFINTYMGADPVLVVRQRDGSIKAHLNACRHRGMKVSREDYGNSKMFTCPYHGWSYGMDGSLKSVPHDYAYGDVLDRAKCGLAGAAKVASYRGLVFATFDPAAPELEDYLGDMRFYLDASFNRSEAGVEVLGGVSKWSIKANWKMAAEQFAGDMYHGYTAHISPAMVMAPENLDVDMAAPISVGGQASDPHGHGAGWFLTDDAESWGNATLPAALRDYLARTRADAAERLDAARAQMEGHNTVFPNFSFLTPECPTVRVWHPRGPGAMEVWSWTYVPADAPAEIKDGLRRLVALQFSASGLFEQDDGDNWAAIQANLAGAQVRKQPFNFQLGMGSSTAPDPSVYAGRLGPVMGEMASREFFRWWRDLMVSPDYPAPSGPVVGQTSPAVIQ